MRERREGTKEGNERTRKQRRAPLKTEQSPAGAPCLSNLLSTQKAMSTQVQAEAWQCNGQSRLYGSLRNQYSLIIYRDSLCPGAGRQCPWHKWPLPGGPWPGRPAVIPTRGTQLCSSHSSTRGATALFAGGGGGASCQAQWSLNSGSQHSSPGSRALALAGGLPSKPRRHALAAAQPPGPWPPATVPSWP